MRIDTSPIDEVLTTSSFPYSLLNNPVAYTPTPSYRRPLSFNQECQASSAGSPLFWSGSATLHQRGWRNSLRSKSTITRHSKRISPFPFCTMVTVSVPLTNPIPIRIRIRVPIPIRAPPPFAISPTTKLESIARCKKWFISSICWSPISRGFVTISTAISNSFAAITICCRLNLQSRWHRKGSSIHIVAPSMRWKCQITTPSPPRTNT